MRNLTLILIAVGMLAATAQSAVAQDTGSESGFRLVCGPTRNCVALNPNAGGLESELLGTGEFTAFASASLAAEDPAYGAVAIAEWPDADKKSMNIVLNFVATPHGQPDEVESEALAACASNGGIGCKIFLTWNSDCRYFSLGSYSKGFVLGVGFTPASALNRCYAGGNDVKCRPPSGGCL